MFSREGNCPKCKGDFYWDPEDGIVCLQCGHRKDSESVIAPDKLTRPRMKFSTAKSGRNAMEGTLPESLHSISLPRLSTMKI
jgi:predicted amidophosphoribosyltransferase